MWFPKEVVENCRIMSIFNLWRDGLLKLRGCQWETRWLDIYDQVTDSAGMSFQGDSLRISYRIVGSGDSKSEDISYSIPVVYTGCNFGGSRPWFLCPGEVNGVTCGRRVAKLYKPPSGRYFLCRHCYDLSYSSRRQESRNRTWARLMRSMGRGKKKGKRRKRSKG